MKTSKSHEDVRVLTDHKGEKEEKNKNIEKKNPTKTSKSHEYVRVLTDPPSPNDLRAL